MIIEENFTFPKINKLSFEESLLLKKANHNIQFLSVQEYENFIFFLKEKYKETKKNIYAELLFGFNINSTSKSYSYFIEFLDLYSDSETVKHLSSIMKEKHMIFDNSVHYEIPEIKKNISLEALENIGIYSLLLDRTNYHFDDSNMKDIDKQVEAVLSGKDVQNKEFIWLNKQISYITKFLWTFARKNVYNYGEKHYDTLIHLLKMARVFINELQQNIIDGNISPAVISLRMNSIISAVNNINIKFCIDNSRKNIDSALKSYYDDVIFMKENVWPYTSIDSCARYINNILEIQNYCNFLKKDSLILGLYLDALHRAQFKSYLTNSHFKYYNDFNLLKIDDGFIYRLMESGEPGLGASFFMKNFCSIEKNSQMWPKLQKSIGYLHDVWTYSPKSFEENNFDSFYPDYVWK